VLLYECGRLCGRVSALWVDRFDECLSVQLCGHRQTGEQVQVNVLWVDGQAGVDWEVLLSEC
jgi:prepilin-type processing-associated H-X9-DG protein